jgi:putative transcriptional regulator
VAHDQGAAHGAQGGVDFLHRAQDELDAPVAARQRIEDGRVEDENAVHPLMRIAGRDSGRRGPARAGRDETRRGRRTWRANGDTRERTERLQCRRSMETVSLANHFLIAMPAMDDPNFSRTLTFICEHNEDGAIGIIVNRPDGPEPCRAVRPGQHSARGRTAEARFADLPVYFGGPVQTDRGFVLHRPAGHWQSSLNVSDSLSLTSSRDILQAMGSTGEPAEVLVSLGYAGWTAGQLEWELSQNCLADGGGQCRDHFRHSRRRTPAGGDAVARRGFRQLSEVAGHA